jgi:hypothetical protein
MDNLKRQNKNMREKERELLLYAVIKKRELK